ncbi:MAG: DMT family transporter [Muribaculaceae bacterium]|nr:DMT family transporter [Muribaculaceae bacterium]
MEWILPALLSATCLGFYDIFKKLSVKGNNVLMVLLLNTLFGALYLSPIIISNLASGHYGLGDTLHGHFLIFIKAVIVLSSWILGYFAIKHLPLTIQGPVNATRPVLVLVGALCLFGERLNALQWTGIIIGFASLYFISRIGAREGFSLRSSRWLWMSIGAMVLGATSALFDKYLLRSYKPLEVQAWYSLYQCVIMSILLLSLMRCQKGNSDKFQWRWTIPCIALFLTVADLAYFHSLSVDGSMISIVSMIRRGSVIIPFLFGVIVLHEKNVRTKLFDLALLLASLILLVIGSHH